MNASIERLRWSETRTVGHMWWCGDEECDCTQPKVERLTPNLVAGYPWIHREVLWRGTFCTGATPQEREAQEQELAAALERYGATRQ